MVKTVLVVEDEPGLAELLRINLEVAGFRVLVAHDGLAGLDLYHSEHPDLVTLDLGLPGISGYRLIKLFKQSPPASVPVIVLTALDYSEAEGAVRSGADDFMSKPFEPGELLDRIKYLLTPAREESSRTQQTPPLRLSWAPLRHFNAVATERSMTLFDVIDKAAELGFDGLEIGWRLPALWDKEYLLAVRDRMKNRGLACSMITPASNFTNPDAAARQHELQELRKYVDAAVVLGAPCVRLTDGMDYPDQPYALTMRFAIECMRASGEYAAQRGVKLAFENHWKDFFWERPEFAGPKATFVELARAVCGPNIGVNFDFSNGLMWDYTAEDMYEAVRDHVVSVHASDRIRVNGKLIHWGVGEGMVEFRPVLWSLRDAGYRGWIAIEDNNPEGDASTRRSISFLRRLWDET